MIKHEILKPWFIYKNRVLAELQNKKEKFSSVYLALFSTDESFIKTIFSSTIFKYWTKYIRSFFANRSIFLRFLPGKPGLKKIRSLPILFKQAKTIKPIIYAAPNLQSYKGKSFVYDWGEEEKRLFELTIQDKMRLSKFCREFLFYVQDSLFQEDTELQNEYPIKVLIFDVDDPNFRSIADWLIMLSRFGDKGILNWNMITFFYSARTDILVKADFTPGPNISRMKRILPILSKISLMGENAAKEFPKEDIVETVEGEEPEKDLELTPPHNNADISTPSLLPPSTSKKISVDEMKAAATERLLVMHGINPERREPLSKAALSEIEKGIIEMSDVVDPMELVSELSKNPIISSELKSTRDYEKQLKAKAEIASQLASEQAKVVVNDNGKKIEIKNFLENPPTQALEKWVVPDDSILFDEIRESTLMAQTTNYTKKQLKADLVETFTNFNTDPDLPLFIHKMEITDASDAFNKCEKFHVELKDVNGRIHTISTLIPKVNEQGYLFMGGLKKFLAKQYVALPVIKKKPDEVQVTSYYNKTFLNRRGNRLNAETQRLKKFFLKSNTQGIKTVLGNISKLNSDKNTSLAFSEWSENFMSIKINDVKIDFDINKSEDILKEEELKVFNEWKKSYPDATLIARADNGSFYFYTNEKEDEIHWWNGKNFQNLGSMSINNFIMYLLRKFDPEIEKKISSVPIGKQYAYNIIRILKRKIPLVILLAFKEGLENLMKMYKIPYEISYQRRNLDPESKLKLNVIPFKDSWLYYDNSKVEHCLLLYGLNAMPTEEYTFAEMQSMRPYVDYFEMAYDSRNIGKGFKNFYDRFLDVNTVKILADMGLPTDFTNLMLHCNTLLKDNQCVKAMEPSCYRIRSTEIIAQALYQEISAAVNNYKTEAATNKRAAPISVAPDGVMKRLTESQNLESVSLLSPIIELEAMDKATFKGIGGINLDDSFTSEYRYYMKDMQGLFGYYSPISSMCGITRCLTYNPYIKDTRGLLDVKKNSNKQLTASQSLGMLEILNPFSATGSDYARLAMMCTQNKHCTPTVRQTKPLICSGMQKVIPHVIGNDFAFKAKLGGVVEKIDEENNVIILKYDDGTKGLIDTKTRLVKNTKSGFFINIKLKHNLKVGKKFKEKEILAYDPVFFQESSELSGGANSIEYTNGCLEKVGMFAMAGTYEDSLIVSSKCAEDLAFYITTDKFISLGKNSNIQSIVKIGDEIKASDPIIVFENSFDQAEVNEVLQKLGQESGEAILEMGRNSVTAKSGGTISDIRVFYNRPLEELSPSLRKLVKEYQAKSLSRINIMQENISDDVLDVSATEQINYDTLYGNHFDGVLIQFFITHKDVLAQGDKLSMQVALKGVASTVLEDAETPLDEKGEQIACIMTPASFGKRMCVDFLKSLYCNKVLVELKNKVRDILNS